MSDENQVYKSAFTVSRLEALEVAIATGELTVKYSDKEVTYRSIDDMLKARAIMIRVLGLKKAPRNPGLFGGSRMKMVHSKGLTKRITEERGDDNDPSEPGEFD